MRDVQLFAYYPYVAEAVPSLPTPSCLSATGEADGAGALTFRNRT